MLSALRLAVAACLAGSVASFAPAAPGRLGSVSQLTAPALPLHRPAFCASGSAPTRHLGRHSPTAVSSAVGIPEALFNFENVAVLPFWLLMILTPRSSVTQRVMGSYLAFVPLGLIYVALLVSSLAAPGGLDIFSSGAGITLAALSQAFASPGTMAAGWAHYVCFDLFVGRWVWADGLRNKVPARHSLVLGLFFGPLGLLTHLATRALVARGSLKDPVVDGLDDPMSDENLYSLIEDRR